MASEGAASGSGAADGKAAGPPAADAAAPADEIVKFDTFQADLEGKVTEVSAAFMPHKRAAIFLKRFKLCLWRMRAAC